MGKGEGRVGENFNAAGGGGGILIVCMTLVERGTCDQAPLFEMQGWKKRPPVRQIECRRFHRSKYILGEINLQ